MQNRHIVKFIDNIIDQEYALAKENLQNAVSESLKNKIRIELAQDEQE